MRYVSQYDVAVSFPFGLRSFLKRNLPDGSLGYLLTEKPKYILPLSW